jgi:hypothetical protein
MTAQTTARTPAAGTRVAPMIVVIIAIVAFAAGLALAQVVAPAKASSVVADPLTVGPGAARSVTIPETGSWPGTFRNPSIDDRSPEDLPAAAVGTPHGLAEGRNR